MAQAPDLIRELHTRRAGLIAEVKSLLDLGGYDNRERVEELQTEINALGERQQEVMATHEQSVEADRQRERFGGIIGHDAGAPSGRTAFANALIRSGFNPLEGTRQVTLEAHAVTAPTPTTWNPGGYFISPLGMDDRFLYPNLVQKPTSDYSAVTDFRQSARSTTGTVQRAIDATTAKAEQLSTLAAVTEQFVQWAVVISDVPNQLLASIEAMADFLADEGRYRVGQAIDAHVLAQIVAAAPPFGTTGTGLVEILRNAVASMRAVGGNPTLAVLNPTDSASLDLSTSGTSTPYIFPSRDTGTASPVWGMKVVEKAGSDPKYIIDPEMLGILYIGDVKVEADPYTGFGANTTRIRVETHGIFHVRQAEGARRVHAS